MMRVPVGNAELDENTEVCRFSFHSWDVEEFSYRETTEIASPDRHGLSRLKRAGGLLRNQLVNVARSYGLSTAGS
jgi:hypothetical protein